MRKKRRNAETPKKVKVNFKHKSRRDAICVVFGGVFRAGVFGIFFARADVLPKKNSGSV